MGGGPTVAPGTPPCPSCTARPPPGKRSSRGRTLSPPGFSPVRGGSEAGSDPGRGGSVAGWRGRGGAAGAPAWGRGARGGCADRRDRPNSRRAVCLRGDEDGGGCDGAARAAEDGQPVSAKTSFSPGGGERRARPCSLGLRSHLCLNRPFLPAPDPLSVFLQPSPQRPWRTRRDRRSWRPAKRR